MQKFVFGLAVLLCSVVLGADSIEIDKVAGDFVITVRLDGAQINARAQAEKTAIAAQETEANAETDPTLKTQKLALVAARRASLRQQVLQAVFVQLQDYLSKTQHVSTRTNAEIDAEATDAKSRIDAEAAKLKAARPVNKLTD
jgi:hypothetical protein